MHGVGPANITPRPAKVRVRWYVGHKRVRGANKVTYTPRRTDIGRRLKVRVTVTGATAPTITYTIRGKKVRR